MIRFGIAGILVPRIPNATPTPRLSRFETAAIRTAESNCVSEPLAWFELLLPSSPSGACQRQTDASSTDSDEASGPTSPRANGSAPVTVGAGARIIHIG